jgi:hypothetical protein
MEVIQAAVIWVDDVLPFPVETKCLPMIDVDQDGGGRLGPPHCAERNDDCKRGGRRDSYMRLNRELREAKREGGRWSTPTAL